MPPSSQGSDYFLRRRARRGYPTIRAKFEVGASHLPRRGKLGTLQGRRGKCLLLVSPFGEAGLFLLWSAFVGRHGKKEVLCTKGASFGEGYQKFFLFILNLHPNPALQGREEGRHVKIINFIIE